MIELSQSERELIAPLSSHLYSDNDLFSSGETYIERLFLTYHLWEETVEMLRKFPENKVGILSDYEQKVARIFMK